MDGWIKGERCVASYCVIWMLHQQIHPTVLYHCLFTAWLRGLWVLKSLIDDAGDTLDEIPDLN